MAKKADKVREAVKRYLEPDEELRSVGQLVEPPSSLVKHILPGLAASPTKYWYVGVTQKRAIFVRLTAFSKPNENVRFATPLSNVKLAAKGGIDLITPEQGMPQNFRFYFGAKRATGLDIDEFLEALTT
jgi:hypothetical protein